MLSFYSVPACKLWGRPENTKGTRGNAPGVQGPATNILGGPLKPPVRGSRNISTTARVRVLTQSLRLEYRLVKKNASARGSLVLYTRSRFWMQGEFATDCDGSAKHGKWKEPAGTLLLALIAYMMIQHVWGLTGCKNVIFNHFRRKLKRNS